MSGEIENALYLEAEVHFAFIEGKITVDEYHERMNKLEAFLMKHSDVEI